MEKIVPLLEELFAALDGIENPVRIVELVLLAIMSHRLKAFKSQNGSDVVSTSNNDTPAPAALEAKSAAASVTSKKSQELAKKNLKEKMLKDLDLVFSDKSSDEMTDEENARLSAVLTYFGETNEI